MIREIVLDTETTGLNPRDGDRIVEIGAVELINQVPTGEVYHQYINPERDMPTEAFNVHGLSEEFLRKFPVFAEIVDPFRDFVGDGVLVIHNAAFDMAFINEELKRVSREAIPEEQVIDTLAIARKKHPMGPNSLDALCRRYSVDNSNRKVHGALLDAELLAAVYLELNGGRQHDLAITAISDQTVTHIVREKSIVMPRTEPLPTRLSSIEDSAHRELVKSLGNDSLWRKYGF